MPGQIKNVITWLRVAALGFAAVSLIACHGSSGISGPAARDNVGPPPQTPLQPGDDPAYDWEAPGHPQRTDSGDWTYTINPKLSSSRSLRQTTNWLKWAIETYGHVPGPADRTEISGVKFPGCSMEWDEKRFLDHGNYVNETIYSVQLADIDIASGALRADGPSLSFGNADGLANPKIHKSEKFWEKDGSGMKSRGERNSDDASAVIPVQVRDDICRRIGWALVHAVSLCGGKASR